jgi:hypothetical protein
MRILGALVLALLAAAPARADTFGELPFRPVAGVATCVRATGVPGEIARWNKGGIELLRAGAGGLTPTGAVTLGRALSCPELAGQANGAAVAAVFVRGGVRVALRDPGARFAAPSALSLPPGRDGDYDDLAAAVSPRGDAVVAALESGGGRSRVVAFRRAPGGAFGAPEQVATWRRDDPFGQGLAAGVDGDGRVTLAWARQMTSISAAIETASAAAGRAFGAPSRVGTTQQSDPSLAVAADGRALLAFDGVKTA